MITRGIIDDYSHQYTVNPLWKIGKYSVDVLEFREDKRQYKVQINLPDLQSGTAIKFDAYMQWQIIDNLNNECAQNAVKSFLEPILLSNGGKVGGIRIIPYNIGGLKPNEWIPTESGRTGLLYNFDRFGVICFDYQGDIVNLAELWLSNDKLARPYNAKKELPKKTLDYLKEWQNNVYYFK